MEDDIDCSEVCFLEKLNDDENFEKEMKKLKKEKDCKC